VPIVRKTILALGMAVLTAAPLSAGPFEDFKNQATQGDLKPFAQDFGGLIGATDFHSARLPRLGGVDLGVLGSIQFQPSDDNLPLKNTGRDVFGLALLRGEIGLPFGFSVFMRGIPIRRATVVGGGLRYQIYKSRVMTIPDVALTSGYDALFNEVVNLYHVGGSLQASFNLPVLKPFFGFGYDSTRIRAKQPVLLAGSKATGRGSRLTIGVNLTPFPFTYLFASYSLMHGESGAQFGAGARFSGI